MIDSASDVRRLSNGQPQLTCCTYLIEEIKERKEIRDEQTF